MGCGGRFRSSCAPEMSISWQTKLRHHQGASSRCRLLPILVGEPNKFRPEKWCRKKKHVETNCVVNFLWSVELIITLLPQKKCHLHLVAIALMKLKNPSSWIFAPWYSSQSWYQTGLPLGLCVELPECRPKSLQRIPASGTPAAGGKAEGYEGYSIGCYIIVFSIRLLAIILFQMPHPSHRDPWWSISIPHNG